MNTTKERKWLLERDLWWKPLKWVKPLFGPVDCTLCFFKFIHSNTSPYTAYRPQICNHFSVWHTIGSFKKIFKWVWPCFFLFNFIDFTNTLTSGLPIVCIAKCYTCSHSLRKRFNLQMYREVYCLSTIFFLNQLFKLSTSQYIFTNDSTQSGGGKRGGGGHEQVTWAFMTLA